VRILSAAAYVSAGLAFSWLFVQGVGWDRETARLVAVVGQLGIVLLVAARVGATVVLTAPLCLHIGWSRSCGPLVVAGVRSCANEWPRNP